MKGRRLLINTVFLTVTSLGLRALGLVFQVYLTRRLGTAGTGLFGLIMSVNSFASTLAISGIRFAATRLVSEELGRGHGANVPAVVRRCLMYAVSFGLLASMISFLLAEPIALGLIGDERTVLPLRLLSLSLPFLSAGAVLGGYFTGESRVGKSAAASVMEQVVRMAASVWMLSMTPKWDVEGMCCAVVLGGAAGEIFSFVMLLALYIPDRRRFGRRGIHSRGLTGRMMSIAMPLAVSAYARTALTTVQNILVPDGLRRSGASFQEALSSYGMIQGMVFPVITFPQVIFSSLSELLVPELTEEQVRGNDDRISASATVLLTLCMLFSVGAAGALLCFAGALGEALYGSEQVGRYIFLLTPLMPVMYMDSVTDGMLRGLGEHLYSMRLNIVDALLSTALVWVLLPEYAVYGYIFILYASELFNFSLSMRRLHKAARFALPCSDMLRAALAAAAASSFTKLLWNISGVGSTIGMILAGLLVLTVLYLLLLRLLSVAGMKKLQGLLSALK